MQSFETVWQAIVGLEGERFRQKRGKAFTYTVKGGCVVPDTTNRQIPRCDVRRAYERLPLRGPGGLQDLQGPSYLFAILTDPRIHGSRII